MAWLVAPGGELHHTGARSPTLSPAQFGAAMGFSTGYTVLIILPAFLLHTSGLYIASSVGEYSTVERGQCLCCSPYLILSYQLGCTGLLRAHWKCGAHRCGKALSCFFLGFPFFCHAFAVFANNIMARISNFCSLCPAVVLKGTFRRSLSGASSVVIRFFPHPGYNFIRGVRGHLMHRYTVGFCREVA